MPLPLLAQDDAASTRESLLSLARSIRLAENQNDKIDNEIKRLQNETVLLQEKIKLHMFETAMHYHAYHVIKQSPARLSFLLSDQSMGNYYRHLRTQENIKNILSITLSNHINNLNLYNNNILIIERYKDEKQTLTLTVNSLLAQIKDKNLSRKSLNLITLDTKKLEKKHTELNNLIAELIDIDIPKFNALTKPIFALPASGVISQLNDGLSIRASQNALVTAPAAGIVLYAAPFKNLGNIVIIDHGFGYLSILRGLSDIYVQNGFLLNDNEPIGIIGGDDWNKDGKNAMLYFELRYNNESINPLEKMTGL